MARSGAFLDSSSVLLGRESGLSLTSAMMGMLVMVVLMGLVTSKEIQNQQAKRQFLLASYYRFVGNSLSSNVTVQKAVQNGWLPAGIVGNNGFHRDILGNRPTIQAGPGGTPIVLSSGPAPLREINQIAKWQSFGVSGGYHCGSTMVCGSSGGGVYWSAKVPQQPPSGMAYYGYSG